MTKKEKNKMTLIGILLIMPIYIVPIVILNLLNFAGDFSIVLPITMYLSIIIGLILSYDKKLETGTKIISYFTIASYIISGIFYYKTYYVTYEGWGGLSQFFIWILSSVIGRILCCIYYGKLVGWKKALLFFGIYLVILILSVVLGFWA